MHQMPLMQTANNIVDVFWFVAFSMFECVQPISDCVHGKHIFTKSFIHDIV